MAIVDKFEFNTNAITEVRNMKHYNTNVGENWPVVYVLNNSEEAYVGETVNAARRMEQHLLNSKKQHLKEIRIITDKDYNKSVILDLESYLIKHMCADGNYKILNGNNGIQDHEYYDKLRYERDFKDVWNKLKKLGVVKQSIEEIENTELFKYSPYKSLGEEQIKAESEILRLFATYRTSGEQITIIVRGGAGTGKTILAVYLMKLLADVNCKNEYSTDFIDYLEEDPESVAAAESLEGIKKIGIVLPQKSLRTSMKDVFKNIKSLSPDMVLNTTDVVDNYLKTGEKYDLLIVDEAHRLKCRDKGHLAFYGSFDKANRNLNLDKETGTELDWIYMCSKNQIFFRDELQTIRPCDISAERFKKITKARSNAVVAEIPLNTQWRCMGGNDYIEYIKSILSGKQETYKEIDNYEFAMYENVDNMVEDIKRLNDKYGLCRTAAGYAWKWISKSDKNAYDIEIGDYKYRWNTTYDNWITSNEAVNEIGCIHTVQGYDLNYLGVIIGEDIKYDDKTNQIYVDKNNYHDQQGKSGVAFVPELLKEYIINIYLTLMTRGIRGTYIYVCDAKLREYFKQFVTIR